MANKKATQRSYTMDAHQGQKLVIGPTAADQLKCLNLWLVTDGEALVLVGATTMKQALTEARKTKQLAKKTTLWVLP